MEIIEQSLFLHGLLKILFQYQLNHLGRSWDEFLSANYFGLTQYWPTLHPKTHRKRKHFPQTKAISKSKDVETSKLRMPIEDSPGHTTTIETLTLNFETPVVSALYGDLHTVSPNARGKLKLLNKGKVKFDGESNLSEFPIIGMGLRRITRSMKSSTSKAPVHVQDFPFIEILSEEEDYGSVEVSS